MSTQIKHDKLNRNMKIIDLSPPLFNDMPVYPGDPPVKIKQVHTLAKEGWRLRTLSLPTHIGSHVDAFAHMDEKGATLDEMPLENFFGEARSVIVSEEYPKKIGLVFAKGGELGIDLFEKIVSAHPRFVVVGNGSENSSSLSIELERKLLQNQIVTFTDLVNLDKLPTDNLFIFYGFPLNIREGDGSPIRAVAIIE